MIMKSLKLFIIITITVFLYSCSSVKDGFSRQKKDNSDEFLVEKKSPLVMPPDYNELPTPSQKNTDQKNDENEIKTLILNKKSNNLEEIVIEENKSFEDSLLKKIKDN